MTDPTQHHTGGPPHGGWQEPPDLVGTVLADRYKILGVLGDGGMGRVYLGEHVTLRKKVAIKILKQEFCHDRTNVERFLQEARAASMIDQENVVEINDFGDTPFYLSYHGRDDDRALLGELAQTLRAAAPSLAFVAPHLDQARRSGRPRVGVCSQFLYNHSVGRALHAVIAALAKADIDLHLFQIPPLINDSLAQKISQGATLHRLPFDLAVAREHIAATGLDLLIYPEIGMEALTYYLAHARLARVQWNTLGHPCTSGLPAIDTYVSYAALEPVGNERFYSESLLRLPGLPFPDYPAEPLPARLRDRTALGFGGGGPLLICPQSLFKLMPQFDATLRQVLDECPEATLLLPEAANAGQTAAI